MKTAPKNKKTLKTGFL